MILRLPKTIKFVLVAHFLKLMKIKITQSMVIITIL